MSARHAVRRTGVAAPPVPLAASLAVLLVLGTAPITAQAEAQAGRENWPDTVTIATASQGGTYFIYGSGLAGLITEDLGVTAAAEVTGGPVQNLASIQTGDLPLALTTMGPAREALDGNSPVAPGLQMTNVCALFPMYQTPFSLVTLGNSGIDAISKVPAGARIGFGPAGSTSDLYFADMLTALGVEFDRRNGSYNDLSTQLQDGLIDGVAFAAGVPVPAVAELEATTSINIVGFTPEEQQKITAGFPVSGFTIPADTYNSLTADALSVSMWNFAVAGCDQDADFIYHVMKVALDDNARMVSIHSTAAETVRENWDKNTFLQFHPGAVRYYEEHGIDIPAELGG